MTAGEGISLHKICSNAFYLDRTFLPESKTEYILGIADDADIQIHLYLLEESIDMHIHERLNYKRTNGKISKR